MPENGANDMHRDRSRDQFLVRILNLCAFSQQTYHVFVELNRSDVTLEFSFDFLDYTFTPLIMTVHSGDETLKKFLF